MRGIVICLLFATVCNAIPLREKIQKTLAFLKHAQTIGEYAINTPSGIYPIKDITEDNFMDVFKFSAKLRKEYEALKASKSISVAASLDEEQLQKQTPVLLAGDLKTSKTQGPVTVTVPPAESTKATVPPNEKTSAAPSAPTTVAADVVADNSVLAKDIDEGSGAEPKIANDDFPELLTGPESIVAEKPEKPVKDSFTALAADIAAAIVTAEASTTSEAKESTTTSSSEATTVTQSSTASTDPTTKASESTTTVAEASTTSTAVPSTTVVPTAPAGKPTEATVSSVQLPFGLSNSPYIIIPLGSLPEGNLLQSQLANGQIKGSGLGYLVFPKQGGPTAQIQQIARRA